MFTKLSSLKGVGSSTIAKLMEAHLDSADKIIEAGSEGLRSLKIYQPIAGVILEAAKASLPVPAPTAATPAIPRNETAMARAIRLAAEKQGTTTAAIRADLAEKPACCKVGNCGTPLCGNGCKDEPKKVVPTPKPAQSAPVSRILDLGIEHPATFTNPTILRDYYDKLPEGGIPDDVRFVKNMIPICPMCAAARTGEKLTIDDTDVLVIVTTKDGQTTSNASTFCLDHGPVARDQALKHFEGKMGVTVELMKLREAWRRLCVGYRRQIAEAKVKREAELRQQRRKDALDATIADLDDGTSLFWMTEAQVGAFQSPVEAMKMVFTLGFDKAEALELGLLPSDAQLESFGKRWKPFYEEYGIQLTLKSPTDAGQHHKLVHDLRGFFRSKGGTPFMPVMIIRRCFNGTWKYLLVHDSVCEAIITLHRERTRFEARAVPFCFDWLTRRWLCQRESIEADAGKAFEATAEGKALSAFLNTTTVDETLASDGGLMVSNSRR